MTVESLSNHLQVSRRSLEFQADPESGRVAITVMDAGRQTVLRRIPPGQAMRLATLFITTRRE